MYRYCVKMLVFPTSMFLPRRYDFCTHLLNQHSSNCWFSDALWVSDFHVVMNDCTHCRVEICCCRDFCAISLIYSSIYFLWICSAVLSYLSERSCLLGLLLHWPEYLWLSVVVVVFHQSVLPSYYWCVQRTRLGFMHWTLNLWVSGMHLQDLGAAGSTKRPTSCLLVMPVPPKGGVSEEDGAKFKASFDEVLTEVKAASVAIYA